MFRLRKALPSIIPYLSERIYCLHFHFYSFSTSSPPASFSSIPIKESSRSHPHDLEHYNIEVQCPELIKLWHPTKNGNLLPSNVSIRSSEKIWWKCTKGPDHEWFASPRSMYNIKTKKITICPFCDNRKVSVTNSFATLYPKLAAQWHPFLNGDITPSKIMPSSNYNAWWKCENGENHVWKRVVSHRIHPRSPYEDKCPFCCGVDLHSKSLAVCRPDLAKEWDYEKNGSLTPELISKSSAKRVWWICPNGHHYQSTVYNRGSTHNTGCPICSGSIITKDTSLATFGDLMQFFDFDNNKNFDINNISIHSKRHFFWKCPESDYNPAKAFHKWKCTISDMISVYHQECPFCNQQLSSNEHVEMILPEEYLNLKTKSKSHGKEKQEKLVKCTKEGRIRRFSIDDLDSYLNELNHM